MGMTITKEMIESAYAENQRQFGGDLQLLDDVIGAHPKNFGESMAAVAAKVAVVDVTNSTQLHKAREKLPLHALVDVIRGMEDLDSLIEQGRPQAVERLVEEALKCDDGSYTPFSFATKYCCYHNRIVYGGDSFSIIDSTVYEWLHDTYYKDDSKVRREVSRCYRKHIYTGLYDALSKVIEDNGLGGVEKVRAKLDSYIYMSKTGRLPG